VTFLSLAARNALRNRFRLVLTVLGVAVATLTFVLLRTVLDAWTVAADFAAKDRVATRHKVTFVNPLPKRYVDQIRNVPGVTTVTWANWVGAKDPKHEKEFFATIAVDTESCFCV
jgi:putative ABC transport system permease protein